MAKSREAIGGGGRHASKYVGPFSRRGFDRLDRRVRTPIMAQATITYLSSSSCFFENSNRWTSLKEKSVRWMSNLD